MELGRTHRNAPGGRRGVLMRGEDEAGGSSPPVPPGRSIAPAPILRWRSIGKQTCVRKILEGRRDRPHGRYENEKRAVERMNSLTASFCRFHRMPLASGRRRSAAQPVGAAVPQPTRNMTIGICKRVCACCWYSPNFSGKWLVLYANYFRSRVQGQCPWWGAGATPRRSPCAPAENCLFSRPTASAPWPWNI